MQALFQACSGGTGETGYSWQKKEAKDTTIEMPIIAFVQLIKNIYYYWHFF
jgi:hypothetical protein